MKAFIHGIDENGRDYLGTSFPKGGIVTSEYKNIKNLIQYGLKRLNVKGSFHIEAFYNWESNKYGKADIDITVTI